MPSGNQAAKGQHQSSNSEKLGDLKVSIIGLPKESMVCLSFMDTFDSMPLNCLWNTEVLQ